MAEKKSCADAYQIFLRAALTAPDGRKSTISIAASNSNAADARVRALLDATDLEAIAAFK